MYLSTLARRRAIRLLPLVLALAVLAPMAPIASPPVSGSTVDSAASSVDLFDFVRAERGVTIVIDG